MPLLQNFDEKKYFAVVVTSFLAIELASWALSEFAGTPLLKGGSILFLFLISILLITLYSIGKNLTTISFKHDGFFVILVIVGVSVLFFVIPLLVPSLFSTVGMEINHSIKNTVGSIISMVGG